MWLTVLTMRLVSRTGLIGYGLIIDKSLADLIGKSAVFLDSLEILFD